ncbi:hypothetical protein IGI37_002733 [Enterococcus sp. AZ194]|uniref:nitroreductase family protein n=1 Tax=Enterococcus sp. AZ194 TaxID=2774629 RepID=UPI003F2517FA
MNSVIELQLKHKTIRKFKDKELDETTVSQLVEVAQHTATSNYAQSYTIMSITDEKKKKRIAEIGRQPYIAEAGHLFILLSDQARNAKIVEESGESTDIFSSFDKFLIGATDAILAAQNIVVAAESLGLGGVLLGSILNQVDELTQLLELPPLVVPVLGIALGYPDQEPQQKPRLPEKLVHFENTYPKWENVSEQLVEYDSTVTNYYNARDSNKRIETFAQMITQWSQTTHPGRLKMLTYIQAQELAKY